MAWNKDFGELVSSGVWKYLPQSFVSDEDSNIYTFMLSVLCAIDLAKVRQTIRQEERTITNATEQALIDAAKYFGVYELPMEDMHSLALRAATSWGTFQGGGNKDSIKQVIHAFIGEDAFEAPWDITSRIVIDELSLSGTVAYWNDEVSKWGSSESGILYGAVWNSRAGERYGVEITVKLVSGTSEGAIHDREFYQYWDQEEKKILLKQVIDEVRPLGVRYKLNIESIIYE